MGVRVASEWLNSCSGCEISIVDMGERLLDVLQVADIVHIPALVDSKYFGQLGDQKHLCLPEADVGLISGGIRNEEHLEVAHEMRRKCKIIIALGTCATHGGIPALANSWTPGQIMERAFTTETTDKTDAYPSDGVPAMLETCCAVDEKIKVDIYLPGCPPHPDQVFNALVALVQGKPLSVSNKSVCDTCPTVRKGKGELKQVRRFLQAPQYRAADEPLNQMRCLLEQGLLCMGPVTHAGCGGDAVTPRCISARVPCRGCSGPVRHEGNQLLDMLNALASNGIDIKSIPNRPLLLRFSGAHSLLKPSIHERRSS
jgi:F420-non-reducing hydrogenase small subunit